jgi:hypothetical protein
LFCLQRKHLNLWVILNMCFYGEGLLAPRPTPKLEDHPSSAVRGCLFNLFTATLHIGSRSSIRNLRTRHPVVTGTHIHADTHFKNTHFKSIVTKSSASLLSCVFFFCMLFYARGDKIRRYMKIKKHYWLNNLKL